MEHFEPQPLVIAERFKFHNCKQQSSQSVADFVAELKKLASACKFEGVLSEALCDRFVCGMCNYTIVDQTAQGNEMGEKKASGMTQLKA